ncbi:uncharacterized protein PFL1_04224 [Pseudozyma flocculosa PF-1]|nr:uncharacterized protein PFL1_04224 [Pseudozyma flocculosa PF-1]EPQ28397.1 hypothetical protein PFL1_04224 [Pseudozyma flocculosa PF-1]
MSQPQPARTPPFTQAPLPPYTFNPDLTEDENFLTWSVILARSSFSKRGHMGALVVGPPAPPSALELSSSSSSSSPPASEPVSAASRVLVYANNTPLLYTTGHPRNVAEIHAEALCTSLAAKRGICIDGATAYVTYPPCLECFKLLLMAGVRRMVYRKNYNLVCTDSVLVTAEVWGVELVGTMCGFIQDPARPWQEGIEEKVKSEIASMPEDEQVRQLDQLLALPVDDLGDYEKVKITQLSWLQERRTDRKREERARAFWNDVTGETAVETRQKCADWWERWQSIYKQAARKLRSQNRGGFMEKDKKAQKKEKSKQAAASEAARDEHDGTGSTPGVPAKRAASEALDDNDDADMPDSHQG